MKTTADFLDDLRAHFGVPSDNQLAAKMEWERQQVSKYRQRKHAFDDRTAIRVAAVLEIEPDHVLACMAAQRAIPESRSAWERIAAKVAACFLFGIALTGAPSPAPAGSLHNQNGGAIEPGYTYAPKRRKGSLRRAALGLSRRLRGVTLTLALLAPGAALADPEAWTRADTAREAAFQTLLAADCAQTRWIASHPERFDETNPALGKHPTKGRVNAYCLGAGLGHYFIGRWLPSGARTIWQRVTILIEVHAVGSNAIAGVRMEF